MSIDPNTLPDGTAVETNDGILRFKDGEGYQDFRHHLGVVIPAPWVDHTITRVYVPVPDGMTVEDAEAALADADAWVEVATLADRPSGARIRMEWRHRESGWRYYVHRDDLPPADPDAELVEKMAREMQSKDGWREGEFTDLYDARARVALAVVREHEAKS